MKKFSFLFFILMATGSAQIIVAQNIAINASGTAPNASAMLDVQSTTKGMLIPRMSTTERTAIATPATGLLVFDNTTGSFWFKKASGWAELIDSTNTVWTKKDANVYVNNGENVGIGTNAPAARLQISNGTVIANNTGGFLQLGASSNQNLAFDNNEIQSRNNGNFSDISMQVNGGNIGIGTRLPETRLQITNGTDASTVGGFLQLGAGTLQNLGFDNNEIQSRNNGSAATLYLQNSGGDVKIGSAAIGILPSKLNVVNGDINVADGKLTKTNTGGYNMMPLCYGYVSSEGELKSGTPNVIAKKLRRGVYSIKCADITSYTIAVATANAAADVYASNVIVFLQKGEATVWFQYDHDLGDGDFSFVFYNP